MSGVRVVGLCSTPGEIVNELKRLDEVGHEVRLELSLQRDKPSSIALSAGVGHELIYKAEASTGTELQQHLKQLVPVFFVLAS